MTDNVIVTSNNDTVVITGEQKINVVTEQVQTFNVITEGIQGPPGPSGLGGYETEIVAPQSGDLITFSASKWVNIRRVDVSDGGNF